MADDIDDIIGALGTWNETTEGNIDRDCTGDLLRFCFYKNAIFLMEVVENCFLYDYHQERNKNKS